VIGKHDTSWDADAAAVKTETNAPVGQQQQLHQTLVHATLLIWKALNVQICGLLTVAVFLLLLPVYGK